MNDRELEFLHKRYEHLEKYLEFIMKHLDLEYEKFGEEEKQLTLYEDFENFVNFLVSNKILIQITGKNNINIILLSNALSDQIEHEFYFHLKKLFPSVTFFKNKLTNIEYISYSDIPFYTEMFFREVDMCLFVKNHPKHARLIGDALSYILLLGNDTKKRYEHWKDIDIEECYNNSKKYRSRRLKK